MKKINKNPKLKTRARRHKKIRTRVSGTESCPRLSGFRSNKFIYAQLIDDSKGNTIASSNDRDFKDKTLALRSKEVGKKIAEIAKSKGVEEVVFDRGGFLYAGSIKEVADGAREGGLKF